MKYLLTIRRRMYVYEIEKCKEAGIDFEFIYADDLGAFIQYMAENAKDRIEFTIEKVKEDE